MDQIDFTEVYADDRELGEKFLEFHMANKHVLDTILAKGRQLKARGYQSVGIATVFESMRYDYMLKTTADEPFKLNNSYRAFYTRLVDQVASDLNGFFTRRTSQADSKNAEGATDGR